MSPFSWAHEEQISLGPVTVIWLVFLKMLSMINFTNLKLFSLSILLPMIVINLECLTCDLPTTTCQIIVYNYFAPPFFHRTPSFRHYFPIHFDFLSCHYPYSFSFVVPFELQCIPSVNFYKPSTQLYFVWRDWNFTYTLLLMGYLGWDVLIHTDNLSTFKRLLVCCWWEVY